MKLNITKVGVSLIILAVLPYKAFAQDCEVVGMVERQGLRECWYTWPMITSAELDYIGFRLRAATTIDVTSTNENETGETAFYELSYWEGTEFLFQCRSLFRDGDGALRMTASACRSTTQPPEDVNDGYWSVLRRDASG